MVSLKFVPYYKSLLILLLCTLLVQLCQASYTNNGQRCISRCDKLTLYKDKPWCYYTSKSWDYCTPAGGIIDYYTKKGEKCNGVCGNFGGKSYEWCFVGSSWDYCTSSIETNSTETNEVHHTATKVKVMGEIREALISGNPYKQDEFCRLKNDSANYVNRAKPATRCPNERRKNRQIDDGGSCNGAGGVCSCATKTGLIASHIMSDDDHFITTYYPYSFYNLVTSYTTFEAPPNANHAEPVNLTVVIQAHIRDKDMVSTRDVISGEVHNHLQQMDRENDDEEGHLLPQLFGGLRKLFNFAPLSPMLNRAVLVPGSVVDPPCWYDVEALIQRFLCKNSAGGVVDFTIVVSYDNMPASRRPTGFMLSLCFLHNGRLTPFEGLGASRDYYFLNVPTVACTSPNHPWWRFMD